MHCALSVLLMCSIASATQPSNDQLRSENLPAGNQYQPTIHNPLAPPQQAAVHAPMFDQAAPAPPATGYLNPNEGTDIYAGPSATAVAQPMPGQPANGYMNPNGNTFANGANGINGDPAAPAFPVPTHAHQGTNPLHGQPANGNMNPNGHTFTNGANDINAVPVVPAMPAASHAHPAHQATPATESNLPQHAAQHAPQPATAAPSEPRYKYTITSTFGKFTIKTQATEVNAIAIDQHIQRLYALRERILSGRTYAGQRQRYVHGAGRRGY